MSYWLNLDLASKAAIVIGFLIIAFALACHFYTGGCAYGSILRYLFITGTIIFLAGYLLLLSDAYKRTKRKS